MPIYEFYCGGCRRESEILVRSSNWEGTLCPHCGSTKLNKKLSVFASNVSQGGSDGGEMAPCGREVSACGSCCGGGPHHH